jgi:hypothetical protein
MVRATAVIGSNGVPADAALAPGTVRARPRGGAAGRHRQSHPRRLAGGTVTPLGCRYPVSTLSRHRLLGFASRRPLRVFVNGRRRRGDPRLIRSPAAVSRWQWAAASAPP